jgi:pyruvate/2-oxoglutarate dehydrogenase complex dihydrolipoamide dehydrogenase (E3) component
VEWARGAGLAVVRGTGRLAGERAVEVRDGDAVRTFRAREAIVLATGSVPAVPARYRDVEPWTARDATGVLEIPQRLAVVGGGVAACEAATWMTALGSHVTMLVRGRSLLPCTEPFAGEAVRRALVSAGVDVRLGTEPEHVHRTSPRAAGLGRIHGGPVRLAGGGISPCRR